MFYADLHIHSKHSRATSRDADLEHLAWWAARKGVSLVGTGDFTHPAWFDELRAKLTPAEPGLFRLRPEIETEVLRRLPAACQAPTRFLLEVEISTIYKKGEKTRKVHHLIYAASFETAARLRERLARIGNLASDGRPILGLDSRHLLEITLESGPDAYLVPAHIWTPWFAALGSKSGFDSIEECYGDLTPHIFAVETGLSSDPPMNWRVGDLDRFTLVSNSDAHSPPMVGREATAFETELDYFGIRRALETGEGFSGTVEFFPEEGKYHLDGHRACGVRLEPQETRARGGACPACGKPLTVGVLHRVEELADRPEGHMRGGQAPYRSLVQLPEILAELHGVGTKSRTVEQATLGLVERLGPEIAILERVPLEDVRRAGEPLLGEALERLRAGRVRREAGYDGEYGVIRLFEEGELAARGASGLLFALGTAPGRLAQAAAPRAPASPPPPLQPKPVRPAAPSPVAGRGILGGLDPEQRQAAEITTGPLLILAGPGTGKTRTLTHRIAHLIAEHGVAPERCLALTFSRRAKAELSSRLAGLLGECAARVPTATFHGLGLAILTELAPSLGWPRRPRLIDPGSQAELAVKLFAGKAKEAERRLAEARALRRHQALGGEPGATEALGDLGLYLAALRERELFDFDDLLLLPIAALEADAGLAAEFGARWPWISIDEYQDIDALQYRLVRLLTTPASHLCAIGDPDQAIYGFRGADVTYFLRFREDYPAARVVELVRNYRSSEVIVEAASQAIRPSSLAPGRRFVAAGELAPERLVIHAAPTERAEAEWVVATIEDLLGGTSYFSLDSKRSDGEAGDGLALCDFAVLYRTEAQAAPLIEALGRAGLPFRKYSHHPLAAQPGVAALLKALANEPVAAPATVEARLGRAAERATSGASPADAATLLAAAELVRPLAAECGDDLERFLAELALGEEIDTFDPRADRVALLTLHAAKGLEFPVVFLAGCEDGLLPLAFGGAPPENPAEERRLFFVGVTRAERRLYLSHAARRKLWGATREAAPSPFLADIQERLLNRRRGEEGERKPVQLRLL